MDVSNFSNEPENDPQEWSQSKEIQKLKCMPMPMKFIAQFFSDEEWPWRYMKSTEHSDEWLKYWGVSALGSNTATHRIGDVRIMATIKHLHENYARWHKQEYPGSGRPVGKETFFAQLAELGIKKQRRIQFPDGSRRDGVQIFNDSVRAGFTKAGYKVLPEDLEHWPTEDERMCKRICGEIKARMQGYAFVDTEYN